MYVAVTRRTRGRAGDRPRAGGLPRGRAAHDDASNAAWLSFDEKTKGSIEVGKLGDLAVLSDDFLACPPERIKDIQAVVTVVGGQIVHDVAPARIRVVSRDRTVGAIARQPFEGQAASGGRSLAGRAGEMGGRDVAPPELEEELRDQLDDARRLPTVLVKIPNVLGVLMSRPGGPKFGWLNRLNASTRNSRYARAARA